MSKIKMPVEKSHIMMFARSIGDSNPKNFKKGFNGADDIADWFKNDKSDDWRQRD